MYKKARRVLGVSLVAFIAIPALIYSYKYVFGLELYEGDEVEERACRYCAGSGRDEQLALEMPGRGDRCPACAGRGEVQVILPGPRRPVRFRGLVLDALKVPESVHYVRPASEAPGRLRKHPAAIEGATVTFTPATGEPITLRTNGHGRFSTRLAPGMYAVEIRAERRSPLQQMLRVEPLRAPIWREKAKMLGPLSGEPARSQYGMELRALLTRKAGTGELIVEPAETWFAL